MKKEGPKQKGAEQQMKININVKIIGSLIILTSLIIALGLFTQQLLYKDSVRLGDAIEKMQNNTKAGKWDQAVSDLNQIIRDWEEIKKYWSSLIDHQEIDNIDVTLSKLMPLLEEKDIASALSEAATLSKFIKHIPEREKLSLDNLF